MVFWSFKVYKKVTLSVFIFVDPRKLHSAFYKVKRFIALIGTCKKQISNWK